MKTESRGKRVAIVVVGDEVLAADVQENNAVFLAREISRAGSRVERIVILPDDEEIIAAEVRRLARSFDAVLVTGGIGVTHDDVTRQAMARLAGRPLEPHTGALEAVRAWYGPRLNRWRRKLAELPRGARIIPNPVGSGPGFIVRNVYVFPGVPSMLRAMFPLVAEEFAGTPSEKREILTILPESAFAGPLGRIARESREVGIGSYPMAAGGRHRTRLVLKSTNAARLDRAARRVASMLSRLGDPGSD